jgi:glutamate/tyrosine decarboxylase-like PLP-dependent enzyme
MSASEHFINGKATPEQREFLQRILELGLDFVEGPARGDTVLKYRSNATLRQLFSEPLPLDGSGLDRLFDELRDSLVAHSIAQSDPRFLAFPDTGNSVATFAADILASFLNQNLIAVDRSAPAATFIEAQLILWLRELIGFPTCELRDLPNLAALGGMWTSGGNMSNHIAILGALQHRYPQVAQKGVRGLAKRPAVVLARGIEHFSFAGAARVLGLGTDSLLWARANGDYTTDVGSVEATLDTCDPEVEPFMVVAVGGNCRTTGVDDIVALREVCDRRGLWLHVDACHGGCLLFSEQHRQRLRGIELADSVSLDPHKGLFVTYPASYVVFRDPAVLAQFSRYPDQVNDADCMDLGLITPFYGSRGFQSLKLWLLMKHLGVRGMGRVVDERQELNGRLTAVLQSTGLFIPFHRNDFYRQAFVFCPADVREAIARAVAAGSPRSELRELVSRNTRLFCDRLYRSGEVVFDLFSLQDLDDRVGLGPDAKYHVMAMAIGHASMDDKVIEGIRSEVLRMGTEVRDRMLEELGSSAPPAPVEAARAHSPAGW